jgi:hypothetical protein
MKQTFIREKCKFWVKNIVICCPQKLVTKMFLYGNPLLQLLEPVLLCMAIVSIAFSQEYFLSKKDQLNAFILPTWKSLMKTEKGTQEYLNI